MSKTVTLKMAKASPDDVQRVREFFQLIEEVFEYGTYTPESADEEGVSIHVDDHTLVALLRDRWADVQGRPLVSSAWSRVVHGFEVLVTNCCDPAAGVLEWRPDILVAMHAAGIE